MLSDLDRDLGLRRPCDLNLLWPLVAGISRPHDPHNPARLLRLRYRPGGSTRRTWRQVAAWLGTDEKRAQVLTGRALQAVYRALPRGMRR